MINLLPPAYANNIRFGRHNATLRKWVIGVCLAIVGLLIIITGGMLYLRNEASQVSTNIETIEKQLADQKLPQVQAQAKELSGDIKLINQILNQEIRYSDLIVEIGKILPTGTILSGLTLSNKVDGALDLTANAIDHASAARLAANLEDPENGLFQSVDIVSVTCTTSNNLYDCDAVYRALFDKDAKKRFINAAGGGS